MAAGKFVLWIISTFILVSALTASSHRMEKDIIAHLKETYGSRHVIPRLNSSGPLNVTLRLLVAQLVEFNEPDQTLTINGWQKMMWRDEFLVWNPDDFGGQNVIHLSPSEIWVPKLITFENVMFEFTSTKDMEVIVSEDGNATWYTPVMFQTSCRVQIRNFPFDVQHCNLSLMAWTYDMSDVDLRFSQDEDSNQSVFTPNGVWHLDHVDVNREEVKYACCQYPYPRIVYTLNIRRASRFYLFSILIPSILLKMVTLTVFWMPAESGEKVSLGMTNLLAFVLFQQLISSNMPPLGHETAIITIYIFCTVVESCASICVSVYALRLFHSPPDKPIPIQVVHSLTYIVNRPKEFITWKVVSRAFDKAMFILFLLVSILTIIIPYLALVEVI